MRLNADVTDAEKLWSTAQGLRDFWVDAPMDDGSDEC
jgi:hypothetical protein